MHHMSAVCRRGTLALSSLILALLVAVAGIPPAAADPYAGDTMGSGFYEQPGDAPSDDAQPSAHSDIDPLILTAVGSGILGLSSVAFFVMTGRRR